MHRMFDPVIQVLRPISPLAWLPLGLVIFQKSEPAALFAIAVCSMWPTVLNTMAGVSAIPQDYWNVAKVLRLSRVTTFTKVVLPARCRHMFTGFRLSLGIAWLVIVASEMLTGTPGVGGFLWQEYNSLIYSHILLAILTIGIVGFLLDRMMGVAEARLRAAVPWPTSKHTASPSRSARAVHATSSTRIADGRQRRVRLDCRLHGMRQIDAAQPAVWRHQGRRRQIMMAVRRIGRQPASRVDRLPELLAAAMVFGPRKRAIRRGRREAGMVAHRAQATGRAISPLVGLGNAYTGGRVSCLAACASESPSRGRSQPSRTPVSRRAIWRARRVDARESATGARPSLVGGGRPVTTVMITNNIDEALLLSDRIVPMTQGPRATLGPPVVVDLPQPRSRSNLLHDEPAILPRPRSSSPCPDHLHASRTRPRGRPIASRRRPTRLAPAKEAGA